MIRKAIFFVLATSPLMHKNLYCMEEQKKSNDQLKLTHYFANADTTARNNYSCIQSFIETILRGSTFITVDSKKNVIIFKNIYDKNSHYQCTLNEIMTILNCTECQEWPDIVVGGTPTAESIKALQKFVRLPQFKQQIIFQYRRWKYFLHDPLNGIFEKEDFIKYVNDKQNKDSLPWLDGFDVKQMHNEEYLDYYWVKLKNRNENRKKLFEMIDILMRKYTNKESIEIDEAILELHNRPLCIKFVPLIQHYTAFKKQFCPKEIIHIHENPRCIIS